MMDSQPLLKALELNQPIKVPPHAAEMAGPVELCIHRSLDGTAWGGVLD